MIQVHPTMPIDPKAKPLCGQRRCGTPTKSSTSSGLRSATISLPMISNPAVFAYPTGGSDIGYML